MPLTSLSDVSEENIIFSKPVKNIKYDFERIDIETKYPNGKKGPLIIKTPLLFSFGLKENSVGVGKMKKVVGYSFPVCLWSKDGEPTEEGEEFYECLKNIQEICREHLETVYGPEIANDLKNIFNYPEGKEDKRPPLVYIKTLYSQNRKKFFTLFTEKGNKDPDPLDCIEEYCEVKMTLMIDQIRIKNKTVAILLKANDVLIKYKEKTPRLSLLKKDEDY